jgi:hypothetical protein
MCGNYKEIENRLITSCVIVSDAALVSESAIANENSSLNRSGNMVPKLNVVCISGNLMTYGSTRSAVEPKK